MRKGTLSHFVGFLTSGMPGPGNMGRRLYALRNPFKLTQMWLTRKILEGFTRVTKLSSRQDIGIHNEGRDSENHNLNAIKAFWGLCCDNINPQTVLLYCTGTGTETNWCLSLVSGEDREGTMPCEMF